MYNRKALKQEARQLMRASVPHFMLVALVYFLLTTGLSYVVTWLTDGSGILPGALSIFLNILVSLFSMVMSVGFANYTLRLSRKEQTGMNSLFEGFSFAGRSIGVNLLVGVYTVLWMLLLIVGFGVLIAVVLLTLESLPVLAGIITVVLYIAVIVLVYAIILRYAMAVFVLVENPDAGVAEAIRRSVRMMRGHKRRLFVLELSFLGWGLLIALIVLAVMGIGMAVSGTEWIMASMEAMNGDVMEAYNGMYSMMEGLNQLTLWTLLAEIVCLPLTLWLTVYQQTSYARFYNYVGGYDYQLYMNGQGTAPAAPLSQGSPAAAEQPPVQPPEGGYYTPAPNLEEPAPAPAPEETAPVPEEPAPTPEEPPVETEAADGEEEL